MLKTLKDLDLKGKKIFLRVDFNVPFENGEVTDDTRIREALKTIDYIIEKGGFLSIGAHFGRPKGEKNLKYSLKPVAEYITKKGYFKAEFISDCISETVSKALETQDQKTVYILENLRFYPGEEKNEPKFVEELAKPFDIYINDAFGACHRKHASIYGLPLIMKNKAAGFLIEKEVQFLDKVVNKPEHPFAAILGGAKVSDKIGVIVSLLEKANKIIIGGAMAYTFLKYNGHNVGSSIVEDDQLDTVKQIYEKAGKKNVKILLPVDHIVSSEFNGKPEDCSNIDIPSNRMGLDIGSKTIELYKNALNDCKTVLWNGPMGVFENPSYAKGTFGIADALSKLKATVIIGGGDSVSAINKAGVSDKVTHISTGGGASLEYIEYGTLPGIDVLKNR